MVLNSKQLCSSIRRTVFVIQIFLKSFLDLEVAGKNISMLLHQFALFTPFFYVIFGEILPSRSEKMRLKLKTLAVLCVCVGLIALCGYFYRGISGEEDYDGRLAAQGAFDDSILHVKVPGQVRRKQGPKRERLQNILEEEIVGNLMKQVGKEYKHVVEEKVHRVDPPARKARKDFPDPISLKPQHPKPVDGKLRSERITYLLYFTLL